MLVEAEYLMEQLVLSAQRNATSSTGLLLEHVVKGQPFAAAGGFGNSRREMRFAHVYLTGLIMEYRARDVADALYEAYADPSIDGVLLDTNTGGGELVASNMIASAVEGRNKPLVVLAHLAASGGMMATKDADEIVAAGRSARVGSIGVMMSLPKYLRRMYGDYITDIYADTSPDKNKAWNEWINTGSTEAFKQELNQLDAIFMEDMQRARPINKKMATETLAGGVWLAEEAKTRGLVDSIGNLNYAITRLASYAANKYA